jgi:hypothetical protein
MIYIGTATPWGKRKVIRSKYPMAAILAAYDVGEHRAAGIAKRLGIPIQAVCRILAASGRVSVPSRRGPPPYSDRNAEIVALAKAGWSLGIISQAFRITCERVRQIACQYADPAELRAARHATKIETRVCPACGKPFSSMRFASTRHCGRRCGGTVVAGRYEKVERAERIIALRRAGKTWRECERLTGAPNACRAAIRHAARRGLDISDIKGTPKGPVRHEAAR